MARAPFRAARIGPRRVHLARTDERGADPGSSREQGEPEGGRATELRYGTLDLMTHDVAGGARGRNGITVTGTGTAAASVDQVSVTIGIFETRPSAGTAFTAATATATRVLAILADDGVDSRSVRTADLTLGPRTQWRENTEVVLGYQAGQRLALHVTGLAEVERILTDIATLGGDGVRIENLRLTASDITSASADAREAAIADARGKAEHLAGLVGRTLGSVAWVREADAPHRPFAGTLRGAQAGAADSMPIAGGDAAVTASLTVHWDFAE